MEPIRIRTVIGSENLYLPQLEPLIGRWVQITIEAEPVPVIRDEFWTEAARLPETEVDFEGQKTLFRAWRNDPRFEPYWQIIDNFIERDFVKMREWAAVAALFPLEDGDCGAVRAQETSDLEEARRGLS